jgi:hypothetical protein
VLPEHGVSGMMEEDYNTSHERTERYIRKNTSCTLRHRPYLWIAQNVLHTNSYPFCELFFAFFFFEAYLLDADVRQV